MPLSLLRLLLALSVLITGVGTLGTHLTLVLGRSGFPAAEIGGVQALYYVGMALGGLLVASGFAPVRARTAFGGCALASSVLALLHLLPHAPFGWGLLRLLTGLCFAGVFVSLESALHAAVANPARGRAFSVYQVVTYSGLALGQWVVGFSDRAGVDPFLSVALLLAVSAGVALSPMPWSMAPTRAVQRASPSAVALLAGAWRVGAVAAPLGLYAAVTAGVLLSAFYTVYPVVVNQLTDDVVATGDHLSLALLGAMLVQWPIAFCSDRFGRPQTLACVAALMLAALAVLVGSPTLAVLRSAGLLFVALIFVVYTLGAADVNDRIDEADRVLAGAALFVSFALGGTLGSVLANWAFELRGARSFFGAVAAVATALALAAALAVVRRRSPGVPVRCA